jgi:hypothetical protein
MVRSKKRIKFIILGIVVLTLLSLYFLYNPTDYELFPDCPFYTITGAYCPGCGSQRAIHDIIHLNILEAISHNALLVFTLFFGGGFYLYSKSKFYNLIYHPKAPWIILGVIALFWILRNLHIHPFHFLAP